MRQRNKHAEAATDQAIGATCRLTFSLLAMA
jgi:hypothetical protein